MTDPASSTQPESPLRLGDLQLAILRVLWAESEATVVRVHEVIEPVRGCTASTVATMLSKMEARGLVTHRKEGRQFVYRALVAEEQAQRSMVRDVTSRLFGGDPLELVHHLVREDEIDTTDLDAIREMIEARRAREASDARTSDEPEATP